MYSHLEWLSFDSMLNVQIEKSIIHNPHSRLVMLGIRMEYRKGFQRRKRMRFQLIREFQVFTKWMNFTYAARELGSTQSSLSKHMAALEDEVGASLIGRSGAEMFLTPAGKVFLQESSLLLANYEDIVDHCREIDKLPETRLVFQEQLQNTAMIALYALARDYQTSVVTENIQVSFEVLHRLNPLDALREGKVDVALGVRCMDTDSFRAEMEDAGFCTAPLVEERMVVWIQKGNPLILKGFSLKLEDFFDCSIMTTAGEAYDYIGNAIRDLFERNDKNPRFRMVVQDIHWGLSDYFMTDFEDSVLFTTMGAINDVRLNSRNDITHIVLEDERMSLSSILLSARDNKQACSFVEYAAAAAKVAGQAKYAAFNGKDS